MKKAKPHIVIISGLSGSGKSTAIKSLEDIGFFCIDNLPVIVFDKFLTLCEKHGEISKVAIVIDIREWQFLDEFKRVLKKLKRGRYTIDILFLECSDETLIRRFKETRRKHPLESEGLSIIESIKKERKALEMLKEEATWIIDSSDFNPHELKNLIFSTFSAPEKRKRLTVSFISFGYKFGIPKEADYIFDCRFLPNPFFVETLKNKSGMDGEVRKYVLEGKETKKFIQYLFNILKYVLPRHEKEGRLGVTIGLGCTGGRHRSIVIAEEISRKIQQIGYNFYIFHRDIEAQ